MAIGTFSPLRLVLNASYSPPTYIIYLVPGTGLLVPSNTAMGVIWQWLLTSLVHRTETLAPSPYCEGPHQNTTTYYLMFSSWQLVPCTTVSLPKYLIYLVPRTRPFTSFPLGNRFHMASRPCQTTLSTWCSGPKSESLIEQELNIRNYAFSFLMRGMIYSVIWFSDSSQRVLAPIYPINSRNMCFHIYAGGLEYNIAAEGCCGNEEPP